MNYNYSYEKSSSIAEWQFRVIEECDPKRFAEELTRAIADGWSICEKQPQYAGGADNQLYMMLLLEKRGEDIYNNSYEEDYS